MTDSKHFTAKHLLSLLYFFALLLVACLLLAEHRRQAPPFSLSDTLLAPHQEVGNLMFHGKELHNGLKGILVNSFVNENALLWHLMAGVSIKSIDVEDHIALVSCYDSKLVSIGFFREGLPKLLGSLDLPAKIQQIKIIGDRALVGLEQHAGIALIDVRDPYNLKLIGNYPLTGVVSGLVAKRDTIYYSDGHQGIGRLSLSTTKTAPESLAQVESAWRIDLAGDKMAVGTLKGTVHLFNLVDDDQLIEVGALDFPTVVTGIAFTQDALAVLLTNGNLHVYQLSSWPNLSETAELKLPEGAIQLQRIPGHAGVAASMAVNGAILVDLNNPSEPQVTGTLKIPETFYDMQVQSGRIYGGSKDGLKVFSLDRITNSESSAVTRDVIIEPEAYELYPWNGHVYGYIHKKLVDLGVNGSTETEARSRFIAIASESGVDFFDRPELQPRPKVFALLLKDRVVDALFRDEHLYVVNREGLQIFSGDRPETLVAAARLPLPGRPRSLAMFDSRLLVVATSEGDLLVVDIRDPHRPKQIASLPLLPPPGTNPVSRDLLVDGPLVFVSRGDGGVYVIDMSEPSQPALQQVVDTFGLAKNMALYDDLLLVANGREGVFIIDVTARDHVLPVGLWPMPVSVDQIAVTDDSLIVSNHRGGTLRLPLPQRLQDLQIINSQNGVAKVKTIPGEHYVFIYDEQAVAKDKVAVQ